MHTFALHSWSLGRLAILLGATASLAVVLTIPGPGITVDEPLDVGPGRSYVATLRARGWRFFEPTVADAVFRDNAEHPPLGRWLLGLASTIGEPFEVLWRGTADPLRLSIHSARIAPALAFGLLVLLVVRTAGARGGRSAGLSAGFALVAMPRVFAHAHLGALDTFLSFFWTLALLHVQRAIAQPRPIGSMAFAGLTLGLALLTKIHAWFLIPIVLVWSLHRGGGVRAVGAWIIWVGVGFATFVLGWPWLWSHPRERLLAYWGTGVVRSAIQVQYLGVVYRDRDVPWHYPWFYFAVTVPVGLHLLGSWGLAVALRRRSRVVEAPLWASVICGFLLLFSTTVPVYDGERLFLLVFPFWAVFIGIGFSDVWRSLEHRRRLRLTVAALLLAQSWGLFRTHPFGLSYYNAFVGGLPGAEQLGLELTYWNDAVDPVLLDDLVRHWRAGETVALVPTLYEGQGLMCTTRAMARRGVLIGDDGTVEGADWIVVSRRSAYWKATLAHRLARGRCVATRSRQRVWLSGLWQVPRAASAPPHRPPDLETPKTVPPP